MLSCIHPEVRLLLINVFCVVIVQNKYIMFSPHRLLVLHRSKIPLVLTTKISHLRSLLFRQQDGV